MRRAPKFSLICYVALFLLIVEKASCGFGGRCGCGLPPPPCPPPMPPPMCPPFPPPCPPPAPCPPNFCPPPPLPIPCPAPIPCPMPMPPPPCPPPQPCGCSGGGYAMQPYQPQPAYVAPPTNDCCCQCGSPCQYRARARYHGARIFAADTVDLEEDPTCNNQKLKTVIEENITEDPSEAKRAIQKAAEEKLFSKINVICAKADFSYVAYTDTYCQASSGDVTCYAFRPISTESNH